MCTLQVSLIISKPMYSNRKSLPYANGTTVKRKKNDNIEVRAVEEKQL